MGGFLTSASQSLTPQNTYQATTPLDVNGLNQQISQSQTGLAQNQAQQQQLANALTAQSNGAGPNPAQNMLNQSTNQNIAQSTGMLASQKGINPALAARLATENAGNLNQQAAGQAATMDAQQRLGAQSQLGSLYGQQANQNLQNISTSGQLANQSSLGAQGISAGVSAQNAAATQNTSSGLLKGGAQAAMLFAAHGGMIPKMSSGGGVSASDQIAQQMLSKAGVTYYPNGMNLDGLVPTPGAKPPGAPTGELAGGPGDTTMDSGMSQLGGADMLGNAGETGRMMAASRGGKIPPQLDHFAKIYHPNFKSGGGSVPLKLSPGEGYLNSSQVKNVVEGKKDNVKDIRKVPGKALVKGDSPKNDIVNAAGDPGDFVIPRTVMQTKDPDEITKFVADHLKKNAPGPEHEDFQNALKKAIGSRNKK